MMEKKIRDKIAAAMGHLATSCMMAGIKITYDANRIVLISPAGYVFKQTNLNDAFFTFMNKGEKLADNVLPLLNAISAAGRLIINGLEDDPDWQKQQKKLAC
jgi:hypothetical protein